MKFKVGDVCIWQDCPCRPGVPVCHTNGDECTIISVDPTDKDGAFYETDSPATGHDRFWTNCWACDNCLILKPPPKREELGEWDLCPWRPERVAVSEEASHE